MDTKDIWLLVAGTILGFVTNVLSTFAVPTVGTAFGKLRSGLIERNKAKALANYERVRDFKLGKRDKYLYAINHWGFISLYTFMALMSGFLGIATGKAVGPISLPGQEKPAAIYLLVTGLILLVLVFTRMLRLLITLGRIENFERYRTDLIQRWPDIELPE